MVTAPDVSNDNFKITFKELFGGGKAELQINYEDGEDPLEAGVEIVACPPGKKLTKISLLSGGERALTAIAILFAMLDLKPTPPSRTKVYIPFIPGGLFLRIRFAPGKTH